MYKTHTTCRACGYGKQHAPGIKTGEPEKLVEILDLGVQPLANDFCREDEIRSGYAPLKLLACPRCMLGQLSVVVDPAIMYRRYSYVTSPSDTMRSHFGKIVSDILGEAPDAKTFYEIGSNDGRLLGFIKGLGFDVLGIDPAENLSRIANTEYGVNTVVGMFGSELTNQIGGKADVVIARHVFCHINDWKDFMVGLERITHDDSLVCIEVPHAKDMIEKTEFDTVYHEHLSYMTVSAMEHLLRGGPFHIYKIVHYPIHGGAIMIMLKRKPSAWAYADDITIDTWIKFREDSLVRSFDLVKKIREIRNEKLSVAALGASAKSTVWINACQFTKNDIGFISDNTPQKQWTFSPGTDIPVVDEGAIMRNLPDYVVVFCWNFYDEILTKFQPARDKGVKFIFPIPQIEIVQ